MGWRGSLAFVSSVPALGTDTLDTVRLRLASRFSILLTLSADANATAYAYGLHGLGSIDLLRLFS